MNLYTNGKCRGLEPAVRAIMLDEARYARKRGEVAYASARRRRLHMRI